QDRDHRHVFFQERRELRDMAEDDGFRGVAIRRAYFIDIRTGAAFGGVRIGKTQDHLEAGLFYDSEVMVDMAEEFLGEWSSPKRIEGIFAHQQGGEDGIGCCTVFLRPREL